jgi:hypothetical protein
LKNVQRTQIQKEGFRRPGRASTVDATAGHFNGLKPHVAPLRHWPWRAKYVEMGWIKGTILVDLFDFNLICI